MVELIRLYLPIVLFAIPIFTLLLLRMLMITKLQEGKGTAAERRSIVPVKIEKGETVIIELRSLEDYEKEFGKGNLIPLWDGRLKDYRGYVIAFDSTREENRFSLGEYVAVSFLWGEEKFVRNEFFFDSNNVKIDLKDKDARFLIVPEADML